MWMQNIIAFDAKKAKERKKLRDAWEKFYAPMQLSMDKFREKVAMRVRKGKFPDKIL